MTDDRRPSAMTGATGDLTPDDADEEFVPAERRAIEDDTHQVAVTAGMHREAERQRAERDAPGEGELSAPNQRDGGYGSSHGLAGDDPAYAMNEPTGKPAARPPDSDRIEGEIRIDPQDDRM